MQAHRICTTWAGLAGFLVVALGCGDGGNENSNAWPEDTGFLPGSDETGGGWATGGAPATTPSSGGAPVTTPSSGGTAPDDDPPIDPGGAAAVPNVAPPDGGGTDVPGGGGEPPAVLDGGYVTSGAWHGYAWTAATGDGSTISPEDFSASTEGSPLCAAGTVGAMSDWSGVAMVGVNLNQDMGANPPVGTVTPNGDGIIVDVSNADGGPLRIQIQGPNGMSDSNDRWCAPLRGSGGFVAWSDFNTRCWDYSGDAYAGQPIVTAIVLVPGDNNDATSFDFCLNSIAESSGPTGGTGGDGGTGGSTGAAGTAGTGGSDATGGAGGSGGSDPTGGTAGTGGSDNPDLVWRQANLTHFTSYPDPGSDECINYNGCQWAGMFAGVDGVQPESWVAANNIAAVHSADFDEYRHKTLRVRSGDNVIDVVVYDMCSDNDCSGCCTRNASETGFLIDLESYTADRFGVYGGIVEWACLDC